MIQVNNAANGSAVKISIIGDIGDSFWGDGYTFAKFKEQISGDYDLVEVEIKSNGGDAAEAFAIYDALKAMPSKVKVHIAGSTASAGTLIAMAGDEITISENSKFLIHRASTIVGGNVEDLESAIDLLNDYDNRIINAYRKKTGKGQNRIYNLMKENRWMTSDEVINWGFADKIIKSQKPILNQVNMDTTELKKVLGVETDEAIPAAVTNLVTRVSELQSVVDQHTAQAEAAKELEISNYVTEAITSGKITATVKDSMINLAKTDFEAVKNIIETAKPAPLKNYIQESDNPEPEKMTPELLISNFKKGVYINNESKYKADYKEAYGKEAK